MRHETSVPRNVWGYLFCVCTAMFFGAGAVPAVALDDARLTQMEDAVVKHICSDARWLSCWGESPGDCVRITRSFTRRCLKDNLVDVNDSLDQQRAQRVGLQIVTCFNKEFVASHPMGKKNTPECKEIPEHLK